MMLSCVAALFSCSGNIDDSSLPVLEVSDTEIDLATETQAVFTVKYNGMDVTAEATILSDAAGLEGSGYTPTEPCTAVFKAVYNGLESNEVTVTVINTDVKVESKYDRHVLVA